MCFKVRKTDHENCCLVPSSLYQRHHEHFQCFQASLHFGFSSPWRLWNKSTLKMAVKSLWHLMHSSSRHTSLCFSKMFGSCILCEQALSVLHGEVAKHPTDMNLVHESIISPPLSLKLIAHVFYTDHNKAWSPTPQKPWPNLVPELAVCE